MAAAAAPLACSKFVGSHHDNPSAFASFDLFARNGIGFSHLGHVGGRARRADRARPSPTTDRGAKEERQRPAPAKEGTAATTTEGGAAGATQGPAAATAQGPATAAQGATGPASPTARGKATGWASADVQDAGTRQGSLPQG